MSTNIFCVVFFFCIFILSISYFIIRQFYFLQCICAMTVKEFWISKQLIFPAADVRLHCYVRVCAKIQQCWSNNNSCSSIWQQHSGDEALSGVDCENKNTLSCETATFHWTSMRFDNQIWQYILQTSTHLEVLYGNCKTVVYISKDLPYAALNVQHWSDLIPAIPPSFIMSWLQQRLPMLKKELICICSTES